MKLHIGIEAIRNELPGQIQFAYALLLDLAAEVDHPCVERPIAVEVQVAQCKIIDQRLLCAQTNAVFGFGQQLTHDHLTRDPRKNLCIVLLEDGIQESEFESFKIQSKDLHGTFGYKSICKQTPLIAVHLQLMDFDLIRLHPQPSALWDIELVGPVDQLGGQPVHLECGIGGTQQIRCQLKARLSRVDQGSLQFECERIHALQGAQAEVGKAATASCQLIHRQLKPIATRPVP